MFTASRRWGYKPDRRNSARSFKDTSVEMKRHLGVLKSPELAFQRRTVEEDMSGQLCAMRHKRTSRRTQTDSRRIEPLLSEVSALQ